MGQAANVRLQFAINVLRQQLQEIKNFQDFKKCWRRYEYFNDTVIDAGKIKIMDETGQIPTSFQDSKDGKSLLYKNQSNHQANSCQYSLLGQFWMVVAE